MSDNLPDDPFSDLPEELRKMLEQFGGGPGMFAQAQAFLGRQGDGPVNWDLARQAALQIVAEGDRPPTDEEEERLREAQRLAEHWLDEGSLPSAPDGGRTMVAARSDWVFAALEAMRPLVEPVAAASSRAMTDLAREQLAEMGDLGDEPELGPLAGLLGNLDLDSLVDMMAPAGAFLAGMHAGQVIGQLARQLLGQYELGLPTAPVGTAMHVAVNVDDVFGDWEDLDPMEVAIVLALTEGAHRRLYHAVPWLTGHLHDLVAQFADATEVDADQLNRMSQELMLSVDPEDPESLQEALGRAAEFRLEPTAAQRRILERIQGVVCLVQAWTRREVSRAAGERLPNLGRIEEVLRRRRATRGDGEQLLQQLLGLDLKPDDETLGDGFLAAVDEAQGTSGMLRTLAHPENLPDAEELAEPSRWLVRMASGEDIPDDASELFAGLGDAPVEGTAEERFREAQQAKDDDGPDARDEPDDDPDA